MSTGEVTAEATEPARGATVSSDDPAHEAWKLLFELTFSRKPPFVELAHELGLAPQQVMALKVLGEPIPMGELATSLHCDSSNVTGLIDRLEERGLVERRPDERDRRVKLLVLTDRGRKIREELLKRLAVPPPMIKALSREDQRTLRNILRKASAQLPAAGD